MKPHYLSAFIITIVVVWYTWLITLGNDIAYTLFDITMAPIAVALGAIIALVWLFWKDRTYMDEAQRRRRWNVGFIAALAGVVSYIIFGYLMAQRDESGLASIAMITGFFFMLPGVFGISGLLARLLVK